MPLVSDKNDAEKYFKQWIPKDWESEGFIKFVDKFPRNELENNFLGKTYSAFVELANIGKVIRDLQAPEIITANNSKFKIEVLEEAKNVSNTKATVLLLGKVGLKRTCSEGYS